MAEIKSPKSPLVGKLQGMHLFGFDGAPCSQRVAFALAEKGWARGASVPWRSDSSKHLAAKPGTYTFRNVSLVKHENLTADYAAIQPNMVVPALVHDGRLIIESMEIVAYLDGLSDSAPLLPRDPQLAVECDRLVELGKSLHVSVRHITFHWSLGKLGKTDKRTADLVAKLEPGDSKEGLAAFYDYFNRTGVDRETFEQHLHALEGGFAEIDRGLASDGRAFLVGNDFSMADIIWAIKTTRLVECGYPFAKHFPALSAWYDRVSARPGFQRGVHAENRMFHHAFKAKSKLESMFGAGIERHSKFAAGAAA